MSSPYEVFRMLSVRYLVTCMIVCSLLYQVPSFAQAEQDVSASASSETNPSTQNDPPKAPTNTIVKNTKVNLSYYFDSRDYNTMNILVNSTALPWGFNIFGFTDIHGTENVPTERFELNRFYHEYRLRRPLDDLPFMPIKGFDLEFEINDSNLPKSGVARIALGYQHSVPFLKKGWLQWRILPWRSDGKGWQLSMTHFLVLAERIKLIGFADYNIMNDRPNEWVWESELSFTLTETFDLILEGRYNGFEEAIPGLDGVGVAGGIRIKL